MSFATRSGRLNARSSPFEVSDSGIIGSELHEHPAAPQIFERPLHLRRVARNLLGDGDRGRGPEKAHRIPGADVLFRDRTSEGEAVAGFEHDGETMTIQDGLD